MGYQLHVNTQKVVIFGSLMNSLGRNGLPFTVLTAVFKNCFQTA